MGKTAQFDLFYRHGFTPYYTNKNSRLSFKRAEIAVQIRWIRHQLTSAMH